MAYAAGTNAVVSFGEPPAAEFRLEIDAALPAQGGVEQAMAAAFISSFRAGGSAEVKKLLDEQQGK